MSDELILAGKLQLKKLQKMKPEKKNSGSCLPDTSLALLPTELRSHMLGARQILVAFLFPVKEFDHK